MRRFGGLTRSINHKFSAQHIRATAQEIEHMERTTGRRYRFGDWAPTQQLEDEQWGGAPQKAGWAGAVGDIPEPVRAAMTHIVRGNLLSDNPIPMQFDVADGDDHGIRVSYGQDTSVSPAVPSMHVTMVCRT
jgi:hypothetical protein